jgi:Zn-dependent M32 family carboxypeptidase
MIKIYATMIVGAVAWCAAAQADLKQDYDTLMYWTRKNVEHTRREKKLETLDEDIYSAILEYYDGSNDTTESEELLQLPSDGD